MERNSSWWLNQPISKTVDFEHHLNAAHSILDSEIPLGGSSHDLDTWLIIIVNKLKPWGRTASGRPQQFCPVCESSATRSDYS